MKRLSTMHSEYLDRARNFEQEQGEILNSFDLMQGDEGDAMESL